MSILHCTSKTNTKFHASYIYLNVRRKFQFSIQYKGNIIDTENFVIIEKHKEKKKSKNPLKHHHLKVNRGEYFLYIVPVSLKDYKFQTLCLPGTKTVTSVQLSSVSQLCPTL